MRKQGKRIITERHLKYVKKNDLIYSIDFGDEEENEAFNDNLHYLKTRNNTLLLIEYVFTVIAMIHGFQLIDGRFESKSEYRMKDIANVCGVSNYTLSRYLSEMKSNGWIIKYGRTVTPEKK